MIRLRPDRYTRLVALSVTDILLTVPFSSYYIYLNAFVLPLYPYDWNSTHYGFDRVDTYPAALWKETPVAAGTEFSRWIYVIGAALFFIFFGLSEDARLIYRDIFTKTCRSCGITRTNEKASASPVLTFTLPSYEEPTGYTATVIPATSICSIEPDGEKGSLDSFQGKDSRPSFTNPKDAFTP